MDDATRCNRAAAGDFVNSSIYASGIAIPVISAATLKGTTQVLIKGLKTGESEIVQEGGEYVIRQIIKQSDKARLINKLETLSDCDEIIKWLKSIDEAEHLGLISKLDELEYSYLQKLNTDLASGSMGPELKSLLKTDVDVDIWKILKDNPEEGFELAKIEASWEKWSKANFFKTVTKKGKDFEELVCLNAFKNRQSSEYLQLKQKFMQDFGKNLDDYDMYSQVQLYYSGDNYFVADQLFVKYDAFGNVEDILVLENKLSLNTPLTDPQKEALKSYSYNVRNVNKASETGSNTLLQGDELIFSKDIQWYKVHDSENGDVISGIKKLK